jgi:hypothetical protein
MLGANLPREPFRAVIGNLAWTHDGSVWAIWRIDPVAYRYAATEDKTSFGRAAATMLRALRGEPLILSLAARVDPAETTRRSLTGVDTTRHPIYGEITGAYRQLLDQVDLRERTYWLALPLPHPGSLAAAGNVLSAAAGGVSRSFGLTPPAPDAAEVRSRAAQAARVTRAIAGLTPATAAEVVWMHHRAARRGTPGEPCLSTARRRASAPRWHDGRLRTPSYAHLGEVHLDEGGRAATTDTDAGLWQRLLGAGARWLSDGGTGGATSPFSHRFLRITTPDAGASYQAFLVLSDLPEQWLFPGGEWLAALHEDTAFALDWAIRARVVPGNEAKVKIGRKRRQLADQLGEFTPGENEDPGTAEAELPSFVSTGQRQLAEQQAGLDANAAEVEYQATIVLGVWGDSREQCEHRAEALRLAMSDDLNAVRPTGDQIGCYAAMLPAVAAPRVVADYTQFLLADDLAKAMPFVGGRLGDASGPILGLSADGGMTEPVQLHIADWTARDISASLGLFAELGAGKSVTLKKILADVGAAGGRTIGWDRTRPREQVVFLSAVFGTEQVQVVDLAAATGFSLDPLRVLPPAAAVTAAETFVTQLLGVDATSERGTVLAEALEVVCARPRRSMAALVDELAERGAGDPAAADLARQLRAAARRTATAVIFDPDLPPLDLTVAHIVFATAGLALPKRHEMRTDAQLAKLPFAALFGRAVLTLTALVAKTIAFGDHRFVLVHADECYWLTREGEGSPGYDTVLELVRDGRKNNAGILLAGHDPDDTGDDTLLGLLSAVFVGRQRNPKLARRYVTALGVTDPDVAARLARAITEDLSPLTHTDPGSGNPVVAPGREGEFLARIHHRTGRVRVLIPPVERIQTAIRTTPQQEAMTP